MPGHVFFWGGEILSYKIGQLKSFLRNLESQDKSPRVPFSRRLCLHVWGVDQKREPNEPEQNHEILIHLPFWSYKQEQDFSLIDRREWNPPYPWRNHCCSNIPELGRTEMRVTQKSYWSLYMTPGCTEARSTTSLCSFHCGPEEQTEPGVAFWDAASGNSQLIKNHTGTSLP